MAQRTVHACVRRWKQSSPFQIQYLYQKNGGMHTAHNTAYAHIHTELNMCLDSDDCIVPDAVDRIRHHPGFRSDTKATAE